MNKSILIFFAILIANQSFATTDITSNSASCDSGVLGVESGGVALKADYEPETIELRWYDENGRQIAVTSEYSSCTYNDAITIPTAPAKTGYEFAGWKVRPKYNFATLNTTDNGLHNYGKGRSSNGNDLCYYENNNVTCDSSFDDLNQYQWKATFLWGTIYGDAMCSTTSDTFATAGTPTSDGGKYCWCKATAYKNGNTWYSPSNNLSWVFRSGGSVDACTYRCADRCAGYAESDADFRRAVFGVTQ